MIMYERKWSSSSIYVKICRIRRQLFEKSKKDSGDVFVARILCKSPFPILFLISPFLLVSRKSLLISKGRTVYEICPRDALGIQRSAERFQ